jgi:hypothetical protein
MDAPQSPHEPTPIPAAGAGQALPAQPTDRAVLEFLAWRYDRLQILFQFAMAGLIMLSAALNVFLFKQMRLVRVQLPQQRDATIRYAMEFSKRDDITIRNFVTKLQEFAAANPDFRPMLDHYRPHLTAYFLPLPQKAVAPASAHPNTNR